MKYSGLEIEPQANQTDNSRLMQLDETGSKYLSTEQDHLRQFNQTFESLLANYEKPASAGWLIKFHELPRDKVAYNASKTFMVDEKPHMLVRIEGKRADQEFTSKLAIYEVSPDGRDCYPSAISNLEELTNIKVTQDPSISFVRNNWVISWVEVEPNDVDNPDKGCTFRSVTAIGEKLNSLRRLVESDTDTKGVRYVELLDGRIGVTSRPSKDGKYSINFSIADSFEEIDSQFLANSNPIRGLDSLIINDGPLKRWIGPNDMQLLANGDLSLLFHVAGFKDHQIKDYREYSVAHCILKLNQEQGYAQADFIKLLARADDFGISVKDLPPKRADLKEVAYPSCIILDPSDHNKPILLAALRDAGQVGIRISDPLEDWKHNQSKDKNSSLSHSIFDQLLNAS